MKKIVLWPGLLKELALVLLVIALLGHVAAVLSAPDLMAGRGERYLPLLLEFAEGSLQTRVLPVALAAKAGMVLAIITLTGWLVLVVGRLALPMGAIAALCVSVWAFGLAWLPLPLIDGGHKATALWLSLGALLVSPLAARATRGHWQTAQQAGRCWSYPMWALLTGLGLLWLIDYSARAALDLRYLATYQLASLIQANFLLTVGAGIAPSLMRILARLLARLDGLALPLVAAQGTQHSRLKNLMYQLWPRLGLLLLSALACAAILGVVGLQASKAALRAELIRLVLCVGLGWLAYRWLDTGLKTSTPRMFWRGVISTAALLALMALGLLGGGDEGQIMLLAFAVASILGAMLAALVTRPSASSVLLGAALALIFMAALLWALFRYGHKLDIETLNRRLEALTKRYHSHYEYLSELNWLMANTPAGGYGLGNTPFCGTQQSMGAQDACSAIPHQAQSDYVMAILSTNFGPVLAWCLAASTAVWLLGLLQAHTLPAPSAVVAQPEKLTQWTVAIFVALSLVQLFWTCLATLGLLPLTGVTYPLMSHGKASLLVTASLAALGMNRPANT